MLKGRGGSHTVLTLLLHCERSNRGVLPYLTHNPKPSRVFWQLMYRIDLKKESASSSLTQNSVSSRKNTCSYITLSTVTRQTPSPQRPYHMFKTHLRQFCSVSPSSLRCTSSAPAALLPLAVQEVGRARQAIHWPTLYIVRGSIWH